MGLTISSTGISLTPWKPQVLTNIEEWTTAFNTYMLIIVQKFPCPSELLQYMETIRREAKTHGGGLGWCIYDHNFVTKPSCVKHCHGPTLICSHGCIFSPLAPLSCGMIIPFFLTDHQTKLGQRGTEFSTATTGVDLAHYDPIAPTLTDITELAVGGTILGTNVHNPVGKMITTKTNRK